MLVPRVLTVALLAFAAPRPSQQSVRGCESGHWIESVLDDGSIIKLDDGSIWEVDPVDVVTSAIWLPMTEVVVCDDRIINTDDNETVTATRLKN